MPNTQVQGTKVAVNFAEAEEDFYAIMGEGGVLGDKSVPQAMATVALALFRLYSGVMELEPTPEGDVAGVQYLLTQAAFITMPSEATAQ